ncbi:MAG: hypothetical protein HQM14_12570 [SAR324 cluster bacterium]|nr:hypothetical protein [SAR324 cluster bacterium]
MQEGCKRKYFAAIDIGSNAVRMALAHLEGSSLQVIHSWRKFLRLGDDVFHSGKITEASLNILQSTLESFVVSVKDYPEPDFSVIATSAMRDAENRQHVVSHIQKNLGLQIKTISGKEEADYLLKAIQNCLSWGDDLVILADLGGGSLEISIMEGRRIVWQKSLDCGVLRFSKLDAGSQQKYLESWKKELEQAFAQHAAHDSNLILTGGNAKVLSQLIQRQENRGPVNKMMHIPWQKFLQAKASIETYQPQHYVKKGWLRPDQGEVLILSLLIFEQLGKLSQCRQLILPRIGLKESILLQRAQTLFPEKCLQLQI